MTDTLKTALAACQHPCDFRRLDAGLRPKGWPSFADVLGGPRLMDDWERRAVARYEGRREIVGSLLSLRLAGTPVDLAVSLYIVRGWAVPLPPGGVLMELNENGANTCAAVSGTAFACAAGDPEAGDPDAIVLPDRPAVRAYLARQLVDLLDPLFAEIKARTPYGLKGMWGMTADYIAGVAVRRARQFGLDPGETWAEAMGLIDDLRACQPMVRIRPKPFMASWPAGETVIAVKGACCLFFKTHDHTEDRRFCSNCPLLSDDSRAPRVESWLQREYDQIHPGPVASEPRP